MCSACDTTCRGETAGSVAGTVLLFVLFDDTLSKGRVWTQNVCMCVCFCISLCVRKSLSCKEQGVYYMPSMELHTQK